MFGAGNVMVNFNGFAFWILMYIMAIWKYIAIITLPMHCVGNNQISLSHSPTVESNTCVMWYGELTCWGHGICPFVCFHFDSYSRSTYFDTALFRKVPLVGWVKEALRIIGILHRIQSV